MFYTQITSISCRLCRLRLPFGKTESTISYSYKIVETTAVDFFGTCFAAKCRAFIILLSFYFLCTWIVQISNGYLVSLEISVNPRDNRAFIPRIDAGNTPHRPLCPHPSRQSSAHSLCRLVNENQHHVPTPLVTGTVKCRPPSPSTTCTEQGPRGSRRTKTRVRT